MCYSSAMKKIPSSIAESKKLKDFEIFLNSFLNFEKLPQKNIFWLDTMEYFSEKLGNIHLSCPTVHVAGSKGKGSVSCMISSILSAAGKKTGLYTSPHILSFFERITQDGNFLSLSTYEKSAEELINCIKSEDKNLKRPVTWFELITLYAFLCFKNEKMDAAVFETGLGGRLDATNIIKPKVCCIGPIELEHTEFLGNTIEKIAAEKGGIIKQNTPVVSAAQKKEAKEVLKRIAAEKKSPVFFMDEEINYIKTNYILSTCTKNNTDKCINFSTSLEKLLMKTELSIKGFSRPLCFNLQLPGDYQAQNAAIAALAVKKAFPEISEDTIEKGLSKAYIPGRLEIIPNSKDNIPFLILDGAHTPNSINFTLRTLREIFSDSSLKDFNILFACAKDKDIKDITPLFKNCFHEIFLTKPGNVKQSDLPSVEKSFLENGLKFHSDEDFEKEIDLALKKSAAKNKKLLVTGSFYLVSEILKKTDF